MSSKSDRSMIDGLTSDGLLAAADANMIAFWMPYGRAPGSAGDSSADLSWIVTEVPHPLFNSVVNMKRGAEEVGPVVDLMDSHIKARGSPVLWWVGPRPPADDLAGRLGELGLQETGETPAMAIALDALAETRPDNGLVVERVATAAQQAVWGRTAALGTGFSADVAAKLERLESSMSDPGYRAQSRYIGFLDGVPVAASALVLEAGVAGIYAVATLPEARNRGIGRLMTLLPLLDARAIGFRVGILQASSMGRPIYAKMGFSEIGSYRNYLQPVGRTSGV